MFRFLEYDCGLSSDVEEAIRLHFELILQTGNDGRQLAAPFLGIARTYQ